MESYQYIFRWLNDKDSSIVEVQKIIYAASSIDAKEQVKKAWPALDVEKAMVERVKADGSSIPLPSE